MVDSLDDWMSSKGDGRSQSGIWKFPKAVEAIKAYVEARAAGQTRKSIRQFWVWLASAAKAGLIESDFEYRYDAVREFMEDNFPVYEQKIKRR